MAKWERRHLDPATATASPALLCVSNGRENCIEAFPRGHVHPGDMSVHGANKTKNRMDTDVMKMYHM